MKKLMMILLMIGLNTYELVQAAALPWDRIGAARVAQGKKAAQEKAAQNRLDAKKQEQADEIMRKKMGFGGVGQQIVDLEGWHVVPDQNQRELLYRAKKGLPLTRVDATRGQGSEKKERAQMPARLISDYVGDQACAPRENHEYGISKKEQDELAQAMALSLLEVSKPSPARNVVAVASSSPAMTSTASSLAIGGQGRLSLRERKRKMDEDAGILSLQKVAAEDMNKKMQQIGQVQVWWESALVGNSAREELCSIVEQQEIGKKIMGPVNDALAYLRHIYYVKGFDIKKSDLEQLGKQLLKPVFGHRISFDDGILKSFFDKAEIARMAEKAASLASDMTKVSHRDSFHKEKFRAVCQVFYDFFVEIVCRVLKTHGESKKTGISVGNDGQAKQKSAQLKAQEEADAALARQLSQESDDADFARKLMDEQNVARFRSNQAAQPVRVVGLRGPRNGGQQQPIQGEPQKEKTPEQIESEFHNNPAAPRTIMPWLELHLQLQENKITLESGEDIIVLSDVAEAVAWNQLVPFQKKQLIKKYPNFRFMIDGETLIQPSHDSDVPLALED